MDNLHEKLKEAWETVENLLTKGHTAKVEEIYDAKNNLIGVRIHHYPMCRQCVKEREASGQERKV